MMWLYIIIGYVMSFFLSRWFLLQTMKLNKNSYSDGIDIVMCFVPFFGTFILGLIWFLTIVENSSFQKFFIPREYRK